MTKTILTIAIPFLAPFLCYAIWVWFATRKQEALQEGRAPETWQNWPWSWLITTGGAFAIISLVGLFAFGELETEGVYVPPTMVDGEIVPGHYEPAPEPPADD
jgi:cytochrome bd-type quinol oxidase subunit 2